MLALKLLSALGAFAASAAPVAAQSAADPGSIVVEGTREKEVEVVRGLARDITPNPPVDKPVPRFVEPVCFGAYGIARAPGLSFLARMNENARTAGAKLAGDACTPNVLIAFMDDAAGQIRRVRKDQPGVFESIPDWEIKRALAEPGPVKVLSSAETRSDSGEKLDLETAMENPQAGNKLLSGSHIALPVQRALVATVVLIDRKQALGKTLQQLADYATMRALATTRPSEGSEGFATRTILSLFTGEDPPGELTAFDRAYLRALYAIAPNARAASLASAVASEYAKGRN